MRCTGPITKNTRYPDFSSGRFVTLLSVALTRDVFQFVINADSFVAMNRGSPLNGELSTKASSVGREQSRMELTIACSSLLQRVVIGKLGRRTPSCQMPPAASGRSNSGHASGRAAKIANCFKHERRRRLHKYETLNVQSGHGIASFRKPDYLHDCTL